jgi:hypothetical protein
VRVATGLSSDVPAASTSRTSVGVTKRVRAASRNTSANIGTKPSGMAPPPARTMTMVRGRGSGAAGAAELSCAMRRASVTVSERHTEGHSVQRRSKSARRKRSTRLSRMARTVAVRLPPARNAISPIGWPAPISASGAGRPSKVTENRPETTT